MADPPSWRDRDRKKDRSAHRQEESRPRGPAPRVESATAAYKRQLDAVFSGGALPAHLKEKLGEAPVGEAGERQKKLRAVLTAATPGELVAALNAFLAEYELPDDLDFIEKALAHPKDTVLLAALAKLDAHLAAGKAVPRKALLRARLEEVEVSSFHDKVQQQAAALANRLR